MSDFDVLGASAALLRRISAAKAAPSAVQHGTQPRGFQRTVAPSHAALPAAHAVDAHVADAHAQQLAAASRHAVSAGNKLARFPRYAVAGKKLLRIAHRSAAKASKAAHVGAGDITATQDRQARISSLISSVASVYIDPELVNATDVVATVGDIIAAIAQLVQQLQAVGSTNIAQQGQQIADALSAAINASSDDVTPDIVRAASGPKYQAQMWIPTAQSALAAAPQPGAPGAPASGGGGGGGGSGGPSGGGGADDSGAPPDDQGDAGAGDGGGDDGAPPDDGAPSADVMPPGDEGGDDAEGDDGGDSDDGADASDDVQVGSGFDLIGYADVMGRGGGGGGGHGGGGHGGHGGHGHGHGGRGRGRRGGFGWGGWGWGGPWYGDDYLLDDEPSAEEIADAVARKLKQAKHIGGGGGHGGGHAHGHGHGHDHGHRGSWGGGPYWDEVDGLDLLDVEDLDAVLARRHHYGVVGYTAPDTHWYSVATPGAIKDELDKVYHEGETLDRDITSYHGGDPSFASFLAGWESFWSGLKKFYDDNASGVSGWLSRLWSVSGDQVVSYGNQLNDWRAKLKSFSGAVVTEPTMTAIQRREDPTKFNYMPLVYGAIAIVALLGGGYALSKVGAVAALFTKKKAAT